MMKESYRNMSENVSDNTQRISSVITVMVSPDTRYMVYRCEVFVNRSKNHYGTYHKNLTLRIGKISVKISVLIAFHAIVSFLINRAIN